ncbi:MAG TPA: HAMP domain-containing sensor histidine kinase [Steroidobacteraceae bacterium]|nr:HAMP domain-containing sensor histidine kinase [Steroidobacteraceae bacterium]
MLVGLGLMAVPLLAAILTALLQMRSLADTGQRIIVEGVTAARASQSLFGEIASLERTARLYNVLNDAKLLDLYRSEDERLTLTRDQLRQHATAETQRTLDELGQLQAGTRFVVLSTPASASATTVADLSRRFTQLSVLVEQVAQQSNAEVDTQVAALEAQTLHARQQLLWESALLVPLALLALLVLTLGVGRPLRQLDRAISELGQGNLTHMIAVGGPHDLERLGRQLEWLRQRLLELAHERNRFLRHMSHELKTPLANIREGTELLMDGAVGELDPNQREVTAILRENGIKLQRMIENLLSFSAWQTSSVGLEATEFRLRPLVKQVLESQQLTLLSQRVRLDVRIEDITLIADRGKFRLILENLISNAVKYSPKGGAIHLRARAAGAELILDIADSGPGIPPEDRAHIFDAFYTGRAARGTAVKGTGIGLSVVLEFVSAHNGTVQIVDGEFSGAHFRITMPISATTGNQPVSSDAKAKAHAHAA